MYMEWDVRTDMFELAKRHSQLRLVSIEATGKMADEALANIFRGAGHEVPRAAGMIVEAAEVRRRLVRRRRAATWLAAHVFLTREEFVMHARRWRSSAESAKVFAKIVEAERFPYRFAEFKDVRLDLTGIMDLINWPDVARRIGGGQDTLDEYRLCGLAQLTLTDNDLAEMKAAAARTVRTMLGRPRAATTQRRSAQA